MAKYQKRDLIDNEDLFIAVLEAGNPRLRCQSIQRLARPLLLGAGGCLPCRHMVELARSQV